MNPVGPSAAFLRSPRLADRAPVLPDVSAGHSAALGRLQRRLGVAPLISVETFTFIREGRFIGACGHLWFIAVLQQFYLVWPLVIALLPRKRMPEASLGLVLTGLLVRALAVVSGCSKLTIDIMTPGAFETLGMGAWLACTMAKNPGTNPYSASGNSRRGPHRI